MYKTKPRFPCVMPSEAPLNVLALNASLKHEPAVSNTGELAALVLDELRAIAPVSAEIVRLSDEALPVGLGFREGPNDNWPALVTKIKSADIVLFCTPIWWGGRSSLMQRVIERLDALDEEYSTTGRSAIKGKVAGIVITGSEDGALSVMGSIMMVLSWMGFTLPPECAAYWVGEVGQPTSEDREKRLKNMATMHMAKGLAQNLVYYARLLKAHPQTLIGKATCCAIHKDLDAPAAFGELAEDVV
ncbi:MAG TPA: NAD(P)H-dependent oxidoreductase [Vicinamibacterales bacterium]|jgi:multimeric flavodoxin WrbA|nr:NAD(P)H-dependent oxidoreductase [Vicinamibacterales bacterium]